MQIQLLMESQKRIGLVAHDARKKDLLEWVQFNRQILSQHLLFATGSTGEMVIKETGLSVFRFKSGPLGGDQQIGAKIAETELDFLIFFWDPLEPQPHDPDVKALLRLAVLYNIPTASNRATADFLISSPFMSQPYERYIPDYLARLKRLAEEEQEETEQG
jgi:methylglyoxal synthase